MLLDGRLGGRSRFAGRLDDTLLLEGAKSLRADLEGDLAAVDDQGLGLEVRLPDFLGVALGEADVVAVLLAFAGDLTDIHNPAIVQR